MPQQNFAMVLADEFKQISWGPVRVLGVHGFNNNTGAGSDRFLQFHETLIEPAASAVPAIKSLYFPGETGASYGRQVFGETGLPLSALVAAISSTEVNYTAVTNTGLDLTIQVEGNCLFGSTTTIVGDLTTGVDERAIWNTSATNTKRLVRLDFVNNSAGTRYPVIQARDTVADAALGKVLAPVLTTATGTYIFGRGGGNIEEVDNSGTRYEGCSVSYVTTPSNPWSFSGGTNCAIRGVYES